MKNSSAAMRAVVSAVVTLAMSITPSAAVAQVTFTDAPLTTSLPPKAVHVTELRTTISSLRSLRGLPAFAFTDPVLTAGVTTIKAVHITELRTALDAVFDSASIARPVYSDASLAGLQPKRAHIEEIRTAAIHLKWDLQPKVDITLAGTGAGTVSSISGLTCNLSCSGRFPPGTVVTLSVSPVTGSQFTGWSGACTGTGNCQVTLSSDRAVTATFTRTTSTTPALVITGIDRTSAKPFSLVTLTGSGFDPANSAISVMVSPSASVLPVVVPVVWATATSVTFAAPPLLDTYAGAFTSGPVKLQVIAAVGSKLSTSDFFSGLTISLPRATPVSSGKMIRAFLQSAMTVADSTRPALGPGDVGVGLQQLQTDLTTIVNGVSSIIANPAATVSLPTANGTFVLDKQMVDILDVLALGYAEGFTAASPSAASIRARSLSAPAGGATPCLYTDLDPVSAEFLCRGQQARQEYAQASLDAWVWGAKLELGLSTVLISGWAAVVATPGEAAVVGTAWAQKAGKALQVLWAATPANATSLLKAPGNAPVAEPPPASSKNVIDTLAAEGAPVLTSTRNAIDVFTKAAAAQVTAAANAVQKGLIFLRKPAVAYSGANRVRVAICGVRGRPMLMSAAPGCSAVDVFDLNAPLSRATVALDGSTPTPCADCIVQYDRATALCEPLYASSVFAYAQCINAALAVWQACLNTCSGEPQPAADRPGDANLPEVAKWFAPQLFRTRIASTSMSKPANVDWVSARTGYGSVTYSR